MKFWKENQIFEKSLKQRQATMRESERAATGEQGVKNFRFYEGPPTANGRPAIHHVLGRAFKDIMLRYKTMRGYYVMRRAGWDTHGLPVEIEVEKILGLKNKQDIEKYGIAAFNEKAKESVWKYKDEWEKLTERVGMWLDFKHPYITYGNSYIETLWWVFSQFSKKKLLKKAHKVVPWCPRCQTSLSSHELAQPGAYKLTKDPSVFIKFEIKDQKSKIKDKGSVLTSSASKEFLLVWTTTPWTLPANVAVAVNSKLIYTKYKVGDEFVWSYNVPPVINNVQPEAVGQISGKKMVGWRYEALYGANRKLQIANRDHGSFSTSSKNKAFYQVVAADFVDTATGTGLVHIAPAFGVDDYELIAKLWKIKAADVPVTINEQGRVLDGLPGAGKFIKEADKDIAEDLEQRGLLYSEGVIEHEYPFCWRCSTPLIYLARSSWFVEMSRLRNKLIEGNKQINWVPAHLKEGRFGEWLREVKDWAISRERYWGTPLPIWECEKCGHTQAVGSLAELDELRHRPNSFFVLRHGEATHNIKSLIAAGMEKDGRRSSLTKNGKDAITAVAQKLKKERIDIIVASPYFRTQETAKIVAKIAGIKEVVTDKRFEEFDCGVYNWRSVAEHKALFQGNPILELTYKAEGGESLMDVRARMMTALMDLNKQYAGKNILIISHGDPLWMLEGAVAGIFGEDLLRMDYMQPAEYHKLPLHNWPYNNKGELDMHRPYVDAVYLRCSKCRSRMARVKEVADVWFDSGAMPFAEWHYPFENKKLIDSGEHYPADYISEGMDQTRGWFYTLLAVATALGKEAPFKNVVSFGLVLDKNGQKMSKSKGNAIDPWAMFQKYGADAVRWHFYTINPPGEAKRFDENDLLKVSRRLFATVYNSFVFLETYGDVGGSKLDVRDELTPNIEHRTPHVLDRWINARLNQLIEAVTGKFEQFEFGEGGRLIEEFVDDLSRWYIRRSRRRFQRPESAEDLAQASMTLRVVLLELAKLMAPFTPFFSEALHLATSDKRQATSVHLTDWSVVDNVAIDNELLVGMEDVRRLATLGLAERAKAGIKVRQPLSRLKVKGERFKEGQRQATSDKRQAGMQSELMAILRDEVNVKGVVYDEKIVNEVELDTNITAELREEGLVREFTRMVQDLRQEANYKPGEAAMLAAELPDSTRAVVEKNLALIKKEASLTVVEFKRVEKFDAEIKTDFDGQAIWLALRK